MCDGAKELLLPPLQRMQLHLAPRRELLHGKQPDNILPQLVEHVTHPLRGDRPRLDRELSEDHGHLLQQTHTQTTRLQVIRTALRHLKV
jgi:hypothetical protein